jgi:eukaryotic-like serine/threonine-protein kinase
MLVPAERLEGAKLDNGWRIIEKIQKLPNATGGAFSYSYVVEKNGGKAFLKALDYTPAFFQPNTAEVLQAMTEAYNHEKNLCFQCANKHLSRIVKAIDAGAVFIDPTDPFTKVEYLIFELADYDIRKKLESFKNFDNAWVLRALHHVAVGINQLHTIGVAHQDLKPSNVLVFHKEGSKVADLGCASFKNVPSPRDGLECAGDPSYAPPELLYGYTAPDWQKRRLACDLYLMGSLIVFFFTKSGMTALLDVNLEKSYNWINWRGEYRIVLPYLRDAFGRAIDAFAMSVSDELRTDLKIIVSQLCDPDPEFRGHPHDKIGHHNPFSLQRYISSLNLLASKAEYDLLRT